MTATMKNVKTVGMQYGADNANGSFELTWKFEHDGRRFSVTLDNVFNALPTEDDAFRDCIAHINGKTTCYDVKEL